MIQNIKVDIIYYLMASDFEMEFNLCGCCRMRLLTDRAKDKRALVEDMSKAVSRSRVTIICGPLFSDDGLINITAKATNRKLVAVNNKEYGINSDETVDIVEGSLPLVTKDGIFGGLIMESGPQTIILLTEGKSVRKDIMQTLIHPYVEELSIIPERRSASHLEETAKDEEPVEDMSSGKHLIDSQEENTTALQEEEAQDVFSNSEVAAETVEEVVEETTVEKIEKAEETPEETAKEPSEQLGQEIQTQPEATEETTKEQPPVADNPAADSGDIMFVFSDDEYERRETPTQLETDTDYDSGFFIEPKRVSFKAASDYASSYVPSKKDDMFISDLEETYDKIKKEKNINIWLIIILATLGVLVTFVIFYLVIVPIYNDIPFGTYYNEIFGMIE